ncbi:MAG: type II toxin-antitoxin system VapC family toxin [Verrucomicrobia bacterium]|nr:type II toxin-antitoxin system VapC family toxin [Verrucomicrobiota bacterium]
MKFWDSSALVPLLVTERDTARRAVALQADSALAVWWGTAIECESALQLRLREGALDATGARQARERLAALAAAWHEVAPTAAVRTLAIRLLRTHPLRSADARQLAAALTLAQAGLPGLSFLSADTRLADAAEIEGLTVDR